MEHIAKIRLMVFFTMPGSDITYYKIRPAFRVKADSELDLYYQEVREISTIAEGQDYLDKSDVPDWLKNVATIESKDLSGTGAMLVFWTRAPKEVVHKVRLAQARHYEKFRAKTGKDKKAAEKKQLLALEARAKKLGMTLVPVESKV